MSFGDDERGAFEEICDEVSAALTANLHPQPTRYVRLGADSNTVQSSL